MNHWWTTPIKNTESVFGFLISALDHVMDGAWQLTSQRRRASQRRRWRTPTVVGHWWWWKRVLRCSVQCGTKRKNDERTIVKLTSGIRWAAGGDACRQQRCDLTGPWRQWGCPTMVLWPPILVKEVHLKVLDLFLSSNRDEQCRIDVHKDKFWRLGFDLADQILDHCAAYL
jgi:hypothetical protein